MYSNKLLFIFSISIFTAGTFAIQADATLLQNPVLQPQMPIPPSGQKPNVTLTPEMLQQQKDIDASDKFAAEWLKVVDKGDFGTSYEMATKALKFTIPRNEWIELLKVMKGSHGAVLDRKIVDIRTAKNPKGAPAGDYMIFIYDTTFADGKKGVEILSLQEFEGVWRVYTYTLSAQ